MNDEKMVWGFVLWIVGAMILGVTALFCVILRSAWGLLAIPFVGCCLLFFQAMYKHYNKTEDKK